MNFSPIKAILISSIISSSLMCMSPLAKRFQCKLPWTAARLLGAKKFLPCAPQRNLMYAITSRNYPKCPSTGEILINLVNQSAPYEPASTVWNRSTPQVWDFGKNLYFACLLNPGIDDKHVAFDTKEDAEHLVNCLGISAHNILGYDGVVCVDAVNNETGELYRYSDKAPMRLKVSKPLLFRDKSKDHAITHLASIKAQIHWYCYTR